MPEQTQTTQTTNSSTLKEKLQQRFADARQRIEQAKQELQDLSAQDKEQIRKIRAEIQRRIDEGKQQDKELRTKIADWIKDKKDQTEEQVGSWREKRELKHLQRRADRAEDYAINAVAVAIIDADEAELAVIDAIDARLDAETAATGSAG